jgi:ABC-type transporter Mla subunit MlaD
MQEDHYRAQQIDAILEQMELFVLYTRQRIQQYVDWQQQLQMFCEKTRAGNPQLTDIAQEIEDTAGQISKQFARARRKLKTPDDAGELADNIVALIDQSERVKLRKYEQICKEVRAIGNAQDELLGQMREIAKITRQRATVLHTQQPDPAAREFLAEIRAKTQQILRIRYDMEGK